jgi:PAS domain-containing protein
VKTFRYRYSTVRENARNRRNRLGRIIRFIKYCRRNKQTRKKLSISHSLSIKSKVFSLSNKNYNMSKIDYVAILDGSFDAGMLVDDAGVIMYANDAAQILFELDGSSPNTKCEQHLMFWTFGLEHTGASSGEEDTVEWRRVVQMLVQGFSPPEWATTGTTLESKKDFPAISKLTLLSDLNNPSRHYFMVFVRHKDNVSSNASEPIVGSSKPGTLLSRRRQRSPIKVLGDSTDPMISIDKQGHVLSFNEAALESVAWCDSRMIGKNIMVATRAAEQDDPAILVDESGIILN